MSGFVFTGAFPQTSDSFMRMLFEFSIVTPFSRDDLVPNSKVRITLLIASVITRFISLLMMSSPIED